MARRAGLVELRRDELKELERLLRSQTAVSGFARRARAVLLMDLEEKTSDVVGLYLNPPTNAFVVSVDEKTQFQSLKRTQPPLSVGPGSPAYRGVHRPLE